MGGAFGAARLPPARPPPIAAAPVMASRAAHHRVSAGCPRSRAIDAGADEAPTATLAARCRSRRRPMIAAVVRPVLGARTFSR
jgi:hypothetical protein